MPKYTDFLIMFRFEDDSRRDRMVSYNKPVDIDTVYEYAGSIAELEELEVIDIVVRGLKDRHSAA